MTTENTTPPVVQLTQEESQAVAEELGHLLIATTARYCQALGLSIKNPNTCAMIRTVLTTLASTVPNGEETPVAQG